MNPIYKFMLSVNGAAPQEVRPIWSELQKEWQKEGDNAFFRATLSGQLTFINKDYQTIRNGSIVNRFDVEIQISYDNSVTWESYWKGYFYKTDCEINESDRTVTVTPHAKDEYDAILNALDKELDLIPLKPELVPLRYLKRPIVQFYVRGEATVGCYLDGIYWEQNSSVETDPIVLNNTYKFGLLNDLMTVKVTSAMEEFFMGTVPASTESYFEISNDDYLITVNYGAYIYVIDFKRRSDNVTLYHGNTASLVETVILNPASGSGATGTIALDFKVISVFARLICDVPELLGIPTEQLPEDDLTQTNYHYSLALNRASYGSTVILAYQFDSDPTQWGIYQRGQYYMRPKSDAIPMARSSWGDISIWLDPYNLDVLSPGMFEKGAKEITIKDCFPIESVINVMLQKLDIPLTFQPNSSYSQFFYGDTTIEGSRKVMNEKLQLYLTQKSNFLKGVYDEAAQKAIITLRDIFDMFRKCFQCYWFVEDGKLRLEHIWYFKNGGSYSGTPTIGIDITTERLLRNGKPYGFSQSAYTYDKADTVGQYQFGWMDDVTIPFKGENIRILTPFVNQEAVENVTVSQFTTDVDYMQVAPEDCSKDGFVLFACEYEIAEVTVNLLTILDEPMEAGDIITQLSSSTNVVLYPTESTDRYYTITPNSLPFTLPERIVMALGRNTMTVKRNSAKVPLYESEDNKLQNGYLSFKYLQQFYNYDMPAQRYQIGYEEFDRYAYSTKRLKNQNISIPALYDIDILKLIKTDIGNGQVEKVSINLSSRNANVNLRYDTE